MTQSARPSWRRSNGEKEQKSDLDGKIKIQWAHVGALTESFYLILFQREPVLPSVPETPTTGGAS